MKKKVYAIVLAGVLAFALTACSRPEDSGSEPESSAAPTTAPTFFSPSTRPVNVFQP